MRRVSPVGMTRQDWAGTRCAREGLMRPRLFGRKDEALRGYGCRCWIEEDCLIANHCALIGVNRRVAYARIRLCAAQFCPNL